jgi:hypothetical protein
MLYKRLIKRFIIMNMKFVLVMILAILYFANSTKLTSGGATAGAMVGGLEGGGGSGD